MVNAFRHLCGLDWCQNPLHLAVGTQEENRREERCHRWLYKTENLEQFTEFREEWCGTKHRTQAFERQCWTNRYNQQMLLLDRLSMTIMPDDELAEILQQPDLD